MPTGARSVGSPGDGVIDRHELPDTGAGPEFWESSTAPSSALRYKSLRKLLTQYDTALKFYPKSHIFPNFSLENVPC